MRVNMSLKNYIFTSSINTKSASTRNVCPFDEQSPGRNMTTTTSGLPAIPEFPIINTGDGKPKNWFQKVWSFVSVEPVMVCWLLPSCFLYIAIENLALEKSCRVNFGYPDAVCDNMIDKSINNIDCVYVREKELAANYTTVGGVNDDSLTLNASTIVTIVNSMQYLDGETAQLTELEVEVCRAEVDSQILDSALNVYTAPFGEYIYT